jgi:protein arginine N-methyltransferase 1
MYAAADFARMIADRVRMAAYEEALRRTVEPGSVVVDVGTGAGIFALLACKRGAKHVYAIDPNPAIEVAKETVKRNGFGDRITFFRSKAAKVALPEKADVLVSDLRGAGPLFGDHLTVIADARKRFLREGGIQIPQRDTLLVAPVTLDAFYDELLEGCRSETFDLSPLRRAIVNTEHALPRGELSEESLLADPARWATLDYAGATGLDARGDVSFVVRRPGLGHGLALWFRATLVEGVE